MALAEPTKTSAEAHAAPPPTIRLKGTARIEARVARAPGRVVLSGKVVDDTRRALGGVGVTLAILSSDDHDSRSPARVLGLAQASPEPCGDDQAPSPRVAGSPRADRLLLSADPDGRFCVRLALPVDRCTAHFEVDGSTFVDGAELDLPVDAAHVPVALRFDGQRAVVSLDDATTAFSVVASYEDGGERPAAGLALTLTGESGALLGRAITNDTGHATFDVPSARLGAPGPGRMRVAFAGNANAGASSCELRVERRTHVDLTAPDAVAGMLPAGSPREGITLGLVATPRCAQRGCRGAPTGTVQVRFGAEGTHDDAAGGDLVADAVALDRSEDAGKPTPLRETIAHAVLRFALPARSSAARSRVTLRVRYIPDAPWFLPTADLVLHVPVRTPSPWGRLALVLAGVAALAWLALTRTPERKGGVTRRLTRAQPAAGPPPPQGPRVELLDAGPSTGGWGGRLIDAHDGGPIAGARVRVERRGFDSVDLADVTAETTSGPEGDFFLPPFDARPGDEMVAEGALHEALRRALPPQGKLEVALVLRKRALLDHLVAWARRRGSPFGAVADPTPADVQRAAGEQTATAKWARAVEQAAFGGGVVDGPAQAEVERLAPDSHAVTPMASRPGPR